MKNIFEEIKKNGFTDDQIKAILPIILERDSENLEFGFCEKCGIELNFGYCPNQCGEIDIFSEAKYCGKTIRKIEEYLFNTAELGNNINEDYLKQTIKFLNDLKRE